MLVVACVALLVILVRQGVVIADHGLAGWLQGEGGSQTEWEVRASLIALVLLIARVVGLVWRMEKGSRIAST
jgi:hypothetical protein